MIIFKARNLLKHLNGTHDKGHTFRVARMARFIAKIEGADVEVVTLASLLHDIARPLEDKNTSVDHALEGAKMAADFLSQNGYEKTEQVVHAIQCHRFRSRTEPKTLEARILRDADRLDALGAIGIARVLMFSSSLNEALEHFEKKILVLKNTLYTDTAKRIAEQRHRFTKEFVEKLKSEIIKPEDCFLEG